MKYDHEISDQLGSNYLYNMYITSEHNRLIH